MRTVTSLRAGFATLCTTALLLAACGGGDDDAGFDDDDDSTSSSGGGNVIGGGGGSSGTSGTSGGSKGCVPNAGQFEVPGNGCDDDADGKVDNAATCDGSLDVAGNAGDFVKAMGLCKVSSGANDWGVVSAEFVQGYGGSNPPPDGQHGILDKFGSVVKPREGNQLGVLSSGIAREYESLSGQQVTFKWHPEGNYDPQFDPPPWQIEHPDGAWTDEPVDGAFPPGFPKAAAGCGEPADAFYDAVVLRIQIRTPKNAKGLGFDLNFHSSEWPEFVCSTFNDSFVAYLKSAASPGGADNISFDAQGNPVGVNLGFFDRCDPGVQTGCYTGQEQASTCSSPAELDGTGFGLRDESHYCPGVDDVLSGGATGWLTTQAPVQPGETITLDLILADTGDPILDSSILLDNFKWIEGETTTSTSRPPN